MKPNLLVATAAVGLAACAGSGSPVPAGTSYSLGTREADLRARYEQYRSGPPPHLDYESWKRQFGNAPDYTGAGP